jgi:hypothetical protein
MVKAAIERHPAMLYKNQIDGCIPCQNGTVKNLQTYWTCKGTGTPPPQPVAPLLSRPPPLATPPAPPGGSDGHDSYQIEGMPSRCVYIHSRYPNTQFFNHNAYAKDSKRD